MKIAITGGTGFVGGHLARKLVLEGHHVVLLGRGRNRGEEAIAKSPSVTFVPCDLSDQTVMARAFSGCETVAHCAGINREIGAQTYRKVHVKATRNVVEAAAQAGVKKVVLMSFLRARPDCGSTYHESKWESEEIVRRSNLDYTIVRAGVVYGRGDHMLDHLSHAVHTFPVFALVGLKEKSVRPLAIDDLVEVMSASLVSGRLPRQTIALTGPEELYLSEAVRRVARVAGRRMFYFRAPVWFHYLFATICEATMKVPLIARAQVRILSEGVVEPALPCDLLPYDLTPTRRFTDDQIRQGLPAPGAFGLRDLRCCA